MATATQHEERRSETESTDFYLPASSISTAVDRLESIVGRFVNRHGVVLIPDSYNK
ncbi:hypothetical protein [Halobellus captivus]|uniref:hypothetical protein n=1 Tax=Halobellus captivus TaxID=2592614 RepID=UPI00193929BB|nr:hypothetical protein [Halobellus captivus]